MIIKEDQPRWLNFLAKKIDFAIVPKDNFSVAFTPNGSLNDDLIKKNVRVEIAPSLTFWWLAFNMTHPILGKKVELRQAIAHAINRDRYIQMFTNNVSVKANSIYVPGIFGYNPSHKLNFSYDVSKAKQLLSDAGYPNGNGLPVFNLEVRSASTTSRQRAEFFKNELSIIGIRVDVVLNSFPAFLKKQRQGNLQFFIDGWALDYPDSENILQLLISKNHPPAPNHAFYSNSDVDKMFDELKFLPDNQRKIELMEKIENKVSQDLPWIMLDYTRSYILVHDHLKNFRYSPLANNYYKYLRIIKN